MFNQKIIVFKIYLKKLKFQLKFFEKTHRAFIFLIKLKFNLKKKILDIDQISKTRESMLKVIVMQKKNLKRARENDDNNSNSNFNQNQNSIKFKKFKNNKFQQQQQFRQNNNQFDRKRQKKKQTFNKRFRDVFNANVTFVDMSKIQCYDCDKYEHYKFQCFDEKQFVDVVLNEISNSKNEKISQTRRKRNKKNQ